MSALWTDNLEMTERCKKIVDEVMAERKVSLMGATFLISRFCGENVIVPATVESVEIWRQEVAEEAMRRIAEQEFKNFKEFAR